MPAREAARENEIVTLLGGLFVVFALTYLSLLALTAGWATGLVLGVVELAVAWRVTPPTGAPVLRPIVLALGAVTFAWSILEIFIH